MATTTRKFLIGVKEWFWITVGLALYGCAWNMFVLPHGFVGGGFGGISAILYYITGIPVFLWYLGFNVILCGIAYAILGKEFSVKTVFGILILYFTSSFNFFYLIFNFYILSQVRRLRFPDTLKPYLYPFRTLLPLFRQM